MEKTQAPSRLCNRTACRQPDAVWWNLSTRAWYCQKCALKINELNGEQVCVPTCGLCELCCGPIIHYVDLCQIQDGNDIITLDQHCWRKLGEPLTADKYRKAAELYHQGMLFVTPEPSVRVKIEEVIDHETGDVRLRNAAHDPPKPTGDTAGEWDHRVIDAVSYALGGMIGQTDDVDRLMQQIVRGDSTDKMRTAVGIAVAFIRWSQDLKRKREHYASEVIRLQKVICELTEKNIALEKVPKAIESLNGQTPWDFACAWYNPEQIMSSVFKRSRDSADSTYVPPNIDSREFAVWLTEQYRFAMRKGIELGLNTAPVRKVPE